MALILDEGEGVVVPPEGKRVVKLGSGGQLTLVSSDGTSDEIADTGSLAAIATSGSAADLSAGEIPAARFGAGTIPGAALENDAVGSAQLADDAVLAANILETIDLIVNSISVGNGSAATPSIQVGAEEHGLYRAAADRLAVAVAGAIKAYFDGSISALVMSGAVGGTVNVTSGLEAGWRGNTSNGCSVLPGAHDVTIGSGNALANDATVGFLDIPTCPGTPTGTATPRTGKACIILGNTDTTPTLYFSLGGGTWTAIGP